MLQVICHSCLCRKHFCSSDSDLSVAEVGVKDTTNFCPIGNIPGLLWEVSFSAALRNMLLMLVLQEERYWNISECNSYLKYNLKRSKSGPNVQKLRTWPAKKGGTAQELVGGGWLGLLKRPSDFPASVTQVGKNFTPWFEHGYASDLGHAMLPRSKFCHFQQGDVFLSVTKLLPIASTPLGEVSWCFWCFWRSQLLCTAQVSKQHVRQGEARAVPWQTMCLFFFTHLLILLSKERQTAGLTDWNRKVFLQEPSPERTTC